MMPKLKSEETKTISILMVDDDKIDYKLFAKQIENSPYINASIDYVDTYDKAKDEILRDQHDIYFIDYTLGAQSGLDLIQDVTSQGHLGPFIMLTGMDRPDLYQRSSETGVYDYLLKGELNESQLLRTITYTMERRRIEKILNDERLFSDTIVKEVPYMVMMLDGESVIKSVNPRVKRVTSYEDHEIIGKKWPDLIEGFDDSILSQIGDDQNTMSFTNTMVCKGGIKKTIEWTILHNTWRDGQVSITGKDITEELEVEEKRRQDEKIKALGHLAGGVAHEINNLLQPILLNAELLKSLDSLDEVKEIAGEIVQISEVAASIVEDVLIFARQDNKKLEKLSFLNSFDEALRISKQMIGKDINITIRNVSVDVDTFCLFRLKDLIRVLSNLLKNAAYAMHGEGRIYIHMNEEQRENRLFVKVSVKDDGDGIPDNILDNIFNPFYTTKDVGEGTGLGLTMIYNIVDNWGGRISVSSHENTGTEFTFTIPIFD